jgi:hypothetical protein
MTPRARQDEHGALRTARLALCVLLAALAALPAAAQAAPPANDDFADARVVNVGDRLTGTTLDATAQAGEPAPDPAHTRSVWYHLTPSIAETLRIDTCSGSFYSGLTIFTGTGLGDLTEVPLTRSYCNTGSRIYVNVAAATTYYLRVAANTLAPGGGIVLNVARPQVPANDDFEDAQPVGRPAQVGGTTVDATEQPGEPEPPLYENSSRSVWYKLAATATDVATASTYEGTNGAMVAVYTGNSVGSLTEVGQEVGPTGPRNTMYFSTKAGTTYYIAVRSHGDTAEDFTLSISAPSPPPPPGELTPPPAPTCPIQFATGLPTYSGTHSGGGTVCLSLSKDFSALEWFHANNIPGDRCALPWTVVPMLPRALPLVDRRFGFANSYSTITGTFPTNRGARGTLQISQSFAGRPCTSATLTWTATTKATPPWTDVTPPSLRLGGATVQRPLRRSRDRSHGLIVLARCRGEACLAGASATVAGVRVTAAGRTVRPSAAGRSIRLALPARARRALAAALRRRRSVKVRVTVVAHDGEGNRATARRTITLRR